jgi:hypothetical protein
VHALVVFGGGNDAAYMDAVRIIVIIIGGEQKQALGVFAGEFALFRGKGVVDHAHRDTFARKAQGIGLRRPHRLKTGAVPVFRSSEVIRRSGLGKQGESQGQGYDYPAGQAAPERFFRKYVFGAHVHI